MGSTLIFPTFKLISLSRKLKSYLLTLNSKYCNLSCLRGKKCTPFSMLIFRKGNDLGFVSHTLSNLFRYYLFGGKMKGYLSSKVNIKIALYSAPSLIGHPKNQFNNKIKAILLI